ncbi:MAG: hypothetical protein GY861_23400 [bacterium]|nr:hypothetical protein [bacterium]
MSLVSEAFERLYPDKEFMYAAKISYSDRFKAFNANVSRRGNNLSFGFSRKWRGVDREVQIGLIQELLVKVLKDKKRTLNMDLYNSFIKNLHLISPKTKTDPILEDSFNRVNERYFFNSIEQPNLCWGSRSRRTLAHYAYHTDTVTVSTIFRKADEKIIDYLVYHELLHKKLKFYNSGNTTRHHTSEFKRLEKAFENSVQIEKDIKAILRKKSLLGLFGIQKL